MIHPPGAFLIRNPEFTVLRRADMRRILLVPLVAALSVIAWPATPVTARAPTTARGTITAMADDSLTVKVGAQDMKFSEETGLLSSESVLVETFKASST
jgi:hypothetical protein